MITEKCFKEVSMTELLYILWVVIFFLYMRLAEKLEDHNIELQALKADLEYTNATRPSALPDTDSTYGSIF